MLEEIVSKPILPVSYSKPVCPVNHYKPIRPASHSKSIHPVHHSKLVRPVSQSKPHPVSHSKLVCPVSYSKPVRPHNHSKSVYPVNYSKPVCLISYLILYFFISSFVIFLNRSVLKLNTFCLNILINFHMTFLIFTKYFKCIYIFIIFCFQLVFINVYCCTFL